MPNLALIPARGGSKRIPRKNIKEFYSKPIIAYSIEAALESGLFDEVMVSTDDEEIATVAQGYGAEVPFLRSNENSNDFATTFDVITEVLDSYNGNGLVFKSACCIYPTAPFITPNTLKKGYELLISNKYDSVFPVVQYSYPIQRALELSNSNKIGLVEPEHKSTRSQDLIPRYHDAGQFYWFDVKQVLQKSNLWTDNSGAIVLSELEVQDLDTEMDWQMAELKFKISHGKDNI